MQWNWALGWIGIGAACFLQQIKQRPCVTKVIGVVMSCKILSSYRRPSLKNEKHLQFHQHWIYVPKTTYVKLLYSLIIWLFQCIAMFQHKKIIFLNAHHNFCLGSFNFYFCKEIPFLFFCSWKLNTLEDQRDLKLDRVCVSPKSFQTQKKQNQKLALLVVKSTSVPLFWGQFWQCQDLRSIVSWSCSWKHLIFKVMGWEASWAMHILIRVAFWWAASQKPVVMVFRRRRKPDIKYKLWRKTSNFWNGHQHCIVPKRKKSKLFTTLEILGIVLTFTSWWLLQLLNLFCATSTKVRRKRPQK